MRRHIMMVLVAMLGCLLGHTGAVNAQEVITSLSGEELLSIVQELGYRGELGKDSQGEPMIRSRAAGSTFTIYFYQCRASKNKCEHLQFSSAFRMDERPAYEKMNEWNRVRRWARAYLDRDGDPVIQFDVSVQGVTRDYLRLAFERWELLLGAFKTHMRQ